MKSIYLTIIAVLLTGCATGEGYKMYLEVQKAAINAEAMREAARYQALTKIAEQGDNNVKLQTVTNMTTPQRPLIQITPP